MFVVGFGYLWESTFDALYLKEDVMAGAGPDKGGPMPTIIPDFTAFEE